MAKKKKQPETLSWIEINAILGKAASIINGAFRYLPMPHPPAFCQRLSVAGQQIEKLANEAGSFVGKPPEGPPHGH